MPKTILITGVAGGIGRATMTLVAEKGWRVIGVDRNPFDGDFPSSGLFIQADISHADEIAVIDGHDGTQLTRRRLLAGALSLSRIVRSRVKEKRVGIVLPAGAPAMLLLPALTLIVLRRRERG